MSVEVLFILFFAGLLSKPGLAQTASAGTEYWHKITLENSFTSESVSCGDFNIDGKVDVVASGKWFEGPAFETTHEIFPTVSLNPLGYSPTTPPCYVADFNRDRMDDVFYVLRSPGPKNNYGFHGWNNDTCWTGVWYENPGSVEKRWIRHVALVNIANETVVWCDVNNDGIKDLVYSTPEFFGYATYPPGNPESEWIFHPISQQFRIPLSHGVGCGDINNDGRPDILSVSGWWEQPSEQSSDDFWTFHPVKFAKKAAQMHVYDVDGDGFKDVVSVWDAHNYGLVWHRQAKDRNGHTVWDANTILPFDSLNCKDCLMVSQLHALDMADLNGDGLKDLITGKRFWAHGPYMDADADKPAVIYWFELKRSNGGACFTPHLIDNDSGVGNQVIAVDVNADGYKDIVTSNKKGTSIILRIAESINTDK